MSNDKLAAKLASVRTKSTAHMETDERASCIGTMLDDLKQLARNDGCIAAAWAIEILPVLVEQLAPAANCGGPISAERMSGISPEAIGRLVERYGEHAYPKCRLCGADMEVSEISEGRKIWHCVGELGRWMGMERGPEKRKREQHSDDSRHVQTQHGDKDVIELLDAYLEMTKCPTRFALKTLDAEAENRLPAGWSIELEFSPHETSLTLVSPDGNDVDVPPDGRCRFQEAIDVAVELAAEGGA